MLLSYGLDVSAVEPNDAMSTIGKEVTKDAISSDQIEWIRASGDATTLPDSTYDLVTFGSSFNVIDRSDALKESARLLKKGGYVAAMWNHRDLTTPIQALANEAILKIIPEYEGGTRRESQEDIIKACPLFDNYSYIAADYIFHQSIDTYLSAWQSVKNKYWDLATKEGREKFDAICENMRASLPAEFDILYTTKIYMARKI